MELPLTAPGDLPRALWPALRAALEFDPARRSTLPDLLRAFRSQRPTTSLLARGCAARADRPTDKDDRSSTPPTRPTSACISKASSTTCRCSSSTAREALDQPYRFEVELVSEKPDLDLDELLGNRPSSPSPPTAAASTA